MIYRQTKILVGLYRRGQNGQWLFRQCNLRQCSNQSDHKNKQHLFERPITSERLLDNPVEVPDFLKNPHYANRLIIFKFKYILHLNLLASFSVVQAVTFAAATSVAGVCTLVKLEVAPLFFYLLPICALSLSLLTGTSLLSRRVIGEISVDGRDPSIVYLAHLSLWGRRRDLAVHRDQLTFTRGSGFFSTLEVPGNTFPLYLSLVRSAARTYNEEQLEQLLKPELRLDELFKQAALKRKQQRQKSA